MFRCITEDNNTLIATTCEPESTRVLSRAHRLFCPNCKGVVQYNKGVVKSSYFSHVNLECEYIGHEPETPSHRKGKELLYSWLKTKFPTAYVEYEEPIPETGQIADVFIKHTDGDLKGIRWAFEFQHSPLTSTGWEERHNLYKSAGIQDFWILDKAKYLKFSTAKGHTDARKRNDLEKKIYSEVGLCYFLDLEKEELTIDFNFKIHSKRNVYNRKRVVTDYTYHRPQDHAAPINKIRVRMNKEFKYCVLLYDEVEEQMNDRLIWIVKKLKREQEIQLEEELQLRIPEKKGFANTIYLDGEAHIARRFIEDNERDLAEDIRDLSDNDFFEKYKDLIDKLILNIQDFNALEKSQQLRHKLIVDLNHSWDIYKTSFLVAQATHSLEEYLTMKTQDKISLVEYAYNTYKDVFEKLASRHTELTNSALKNIKWFLVPYDKNPNALDYALVYHHCKTTEEIDQYVKQVLEKIINPFTFLEEL
ncbi:MAG: competence protein CoiA [Bacillota bacterium]